MAIGFSVLTSGESNGSGGSVTTASVTLLANTLTLVCVNYRADSMIGVPSTTSTSVTGPITFVRAADKNTSSGDRFGACFRGMGAGTGTITISGPSDAVGFTYSVIQVTGVTTSGSSGAGAVNNASPLDINQFTDDVSHTPSVTISGTPATGDVTFAHVTVEDSESGLTEEGGWTNITRIIGALETSLDVMFNTGQDQTATWSGTRTDGRDGLAIGALIKSAPIVLVNDGPRGDRRPFPFTPG